MLPIIHDLEGEIWKDVVGFEGFYQVSSHGRVKSLDRHVLGKAGLLYLQRSMIKIQKLNRLGYSTLHLCINSVNKIFSVHRLVAKAFIPNPENKPQVNHIDSIRDNNHVDNLEWCTHIENIRHSWANNKNRKTVKGENNNMAKLTESQVIEIRKQLSNGIFCSQIGKSYGVTKAAIQAIKSGKTWKHI